MLRRIWKFYPVFVLIFLCLLSLAGSTSHGRAQGPSVMPGQSVTFPPDGSNSPEDPVSHVVRHWIIILSGQPIAHDQSPNGWNVSYSEGNLTVSAPTNATIAGGYEARYKDPNSMPDTVPGQPQSGFFAVVHGSAPSAPTGLTATPGNAQIGLNWTLSAGATSYNVLRSTTSGTGYAQIQTVTTPPTTDTSVTNGTTYYYVVQAANTYGTSGNSNQASGTPGGTPPPPTGLTAVAGNNQVAISWTASTGATSYNVLRSTTSGSGYTQVQNVSTTTATDTSVTNGTTYYYVVQAVNSYGTSGNSSQASATPGSAPAPPSGLLATAGTGQVALTWNPSTGATSYNVLRSTTSGSGYTQIQNVSTTTATDSNVTGGTTYYYVVQAVNSIGVSGNSNQSSATPVSAPVLRATPFATAVALNWTPSVGATGYTVQRSTTSGGPYSTIGTTAANTNYVDATVTNGTSYYYIVYSTGSGGQGPNSNEASATPSAGQGSFAVTQIQETLAHVVTVTMNVAGIPPTTTTTTSSSGGVTYTTSTSVSSCLVVDTGSVGTIVVPQGRSAGSCTLTDSQGTYSAVGISIASDPETDQMTSSPSGGLARVFLAEMIGEVTTDSNNNVVGSGTATIIMQRQDLNVVKALANVSSIDSRLAFGQSNLAGEISADPNSPGRNVSFLGWVYNGGLFIGNAPYPSSNDQSGTARMQAWMQGSPSVTSVIVSALTLIYLGFNPKLTTAVTACAYLPATSDQYYNVTQQNAIWSNAWSLTSPQQPVTLSSSTPTSQYVNFPIVGYSPEVTVALQNEANQVLQNTACWVYFVSVPYATGTGAFSASDAQPRFWLVDQKFIGI